MFDGWRFILGSGSPRRRELLAGLGIEFTVEPIQGDPESYDCSMPCDEVPVYLARHKSFGYPRPLEPDEVLITADTLVCLDGALLGKPAGREKACEMLRRLSGRTHQVYTGVAVRTAERISSFTACTDVSFKELTDSEIDYYVDNYRPFDKAGAYGVQEWIGYAGITRIEGSYFNVVGLPVQRLYMELCKVCK
ncbi:MAG: septum formation protein Maf [Bacteroidales bacterium]|nr:septum formation protein Maf [Bacteroidales bacterium]